MIEERDSLGRCKALPWGSQITKDFWFSADIHCEASHGRFCYPSSLREESRMMVLLWDNPGIYSISEAYGKAVKCHAG